MSSDNTEELVYSPKHSCAPDQDIYGNCILISTSKIILRNIIVILQNALKTTHFSSEERKFIKKELNYNICNEFINKIIKSDFLHECLYFTCNYEFLNAYIESYIEETLDSNCLDMLLIFIFIYYFLWDLSKNILKHDISLKDIVEGDRESKSDLIISANVMNKAFKILFSNHESFQETMDKNFTIDSDVFKLCIDNPDMAILITKLFDVLHKTPKYILYKFDFSTEEKVFKIQFTIDGIERYSNISIHNFIKILNISSKQKFYTSIGINVELLDDFSSCPEECGGHALYIQSMEGCNSHIRNSWGIKKSTIIQNICKLLSKFIIDYNPDINISFDGMFLSDEESRIIIDDIFKNDSIITEDTTLYEARNLLMELMSPPIRSKKKDEKKTVKKVEERKPTQKITPKKKRKLTQERKKRIKEIRREKRREKRKTQKIKKMHSSSDSGIDEIIAEGNIMGER